MNLITPFSGKNYHEREQACPKNHTPCCVCGKPIGDPWKFQVRVVGGGSRWGTADQEQLESEEIGDDDMGFFPVGSDCARKLRSQNVHVIELVVET